MCIHVYYVSYVLHEFHAKDSKSSHPNFDSQCEFRGCPLGPMLTVVSHGRTGSTVSNQSWSTMVDYERP